MTAGDLWAGRRSRLVCHPGGTGMAQSLSRVGSVILTTLDRKLGSIRAGNIENSVDSDIGESQESADSGLVSKAVSGK